LRTLLRPLRLRYPHHNKHQERHAHARRARVVRQSAGDESLVLVVLQRDDAHGVLVLEVRVAGTAVEEGEGEDSVAVGDGEGGRVGLEVARLRDEVERNAEVRVEHSELGLEVGEGRGSGADDDGVSLRKRDGVSTSRWEKKGIRREETHQVGTDAVGRRALKTSSGVLVLARDDFELTRLLEGPGNEVGEEGEVAGRVAAADEKDVRLILIEHEDRRW
jgi:hypothetical protein